MESRTKSSEAEHGSQVAVSLPKWFIWLASGLLTIGAITVLPWVVWQTRAVMRLEFQMDTLSKIDGKIDALLTVNQKLDGLERRMIIVEQDLNSRKGQRWNKPDHEKYVQPVIERLQRDLKQLEVEVARLSQ